MSDRASVKACYRQPTPEMVAAAREACPQLSNSDIVLMFETMWDAMIEANPFAMFM